MKYKINIEQITEYEIKTTRYEGSDGIRYASKYGIPDGIEYKEVEIKTGEIGISKRDIFSQEVELSDITPVIKAANGL